MPANWTCFRDEIVIDQAFADFVTNSTGGLPQGSILLIAGRSCQHAAGYAFHVPTGYGINLVFDVYDANGGLIDVSGTAGIGQGSTGGAGANSTGEEPASAGNPGGTGPSGTNAASISLFAKNLVNAHLVANGGAGAKGGTGGIGGAPAKYRDPDQEGGWGYSAPGPGGPGGAGGSGGGGGAVAVLCAGAPVTAVPAQIENTGGSGGPGGDGGTGAMDWLGKRRASPGAVGLQGPGGQPGPATVSQVAEADYWKAVSAAIGTDAAAWAQYRLIVGEYRFRAFRTVSPYDTWRGLALDEFAAALTLNPGLTQAQTDLNHILYNRNMLGIARDVDIFPDFDRYDAFVTTSAQLVQTLVSFANSDLSLSSWAETTQQSLQAEIDHLQSSTDILQKEEQAAALDNQIAGQEKTDADQQVQDLAQQVQAAKDALDSSPITFQEVAGVIGDVVKVVMAFPTGGASLLAFAPDILAVANDVEGQQNGLLSLLPNDVVDEITKALHLSSTDSLTKDAGNLATLIQKNYAEVNNLINLTEAVANVGQATSTAQAAYKQLLAKSIQAVHAQFLAGLRSSQTDILQQVAAEKLTQLATDIQTAQAQLASVNAGIKDINAAAQAIITVSHSYFDVVARFAFYAARALEIYTLDDLSGEIRFDYGYVHPDIDQDYASKRSTATQYLSAYQAAWQEVPTVMDYRQRYLDYFANSPADLTRDIYVRSITDQATLTTFSQQRALQITVDVADPALAGRAEAKAELVAVSLIGLGPSTFIDCRVEHNGTCDQRRTDGTILTQFLRPHSTIVQSKVQPLVPTDLIPDPKTDPLAAPLSIAFWGRGLATTWQLTIEDPKVDLSTLSQIQIGIGYVAFLA